MPDPRSRDEDREFLTIGETKMLLRESAAEHRQLAETCANLSRAVDLLQEAIKPIKKLVDGNGRGPLGERIIVLEGLVRNVDNNFREWVAEFRQKQQTTEFTAAENSKMIAQREARIASLEEWRTSHTRVVWAIIGPALAIIVGAVVYGVAHWISFVK